MDDWQPPELRLMTVGELREALSGIPDDAALQVYVDEAGSPSRLQRLFRDPPPGHFFRRRWPVMAKYNAEHRRVSLYTAPEDWEP